MEQCSSALTKQEIESIWDWPATGAAYNAGGLALVSAVKTEITQCKEKSYFSLWAHMVPITGCFLWGIHACL